MGVKMRTVRTMEGKEPSEYVGEWYPGQCQAQSVYLLLGDGDTEYRTTPLGGGCSIDLWNGIHERVYFNCRVLSVEECEQFVEDNKELIEKIFESYTEKYDGSNYKGFWNQDLVDELQRKADEFEGEFDFWEDEDEEEVEEEA